MMGGGVKQNKGGLIMDEGKSTWHLERGEGFTAHFFFNGQKNNT